MIDEKKRNAFWKSVANHKWESLEEIRNYYKDLV